MTVWWQRRPSHNTLAHIRWLTCGGCRWQLSQLDRRPVVADFRCWHHHQQEVVRVWEGPAWAEDAVDVGLVPVLRRLWYAGARTFSSCQESGAGWAVIGVRDDSASAETVLPLLPPGGSFRERMEEGAFPVDWYQFPGIAGDRLRPRW